MPEPTIRRAAGQDAPRLAELSGVLGYPAAAAELGARLERLLASSQDIVLVAESATGETVGWLHGAEQELLESGRRCEILGLVIDPEHRGQGIGRLLTAACIELAREEGAPGIGLMTTEMMAVAKGMYERMGFEQTEEYQTDYPVRFWAYGMRLDDGARDS